jgi:hypothetical protein
MERKHNFNTAFFGLFQNKDKTTTVRVMADSWQSATSLITQQANNDPELGTLQGIVREDLLTGNWLGSTK